MKIIENYIKLFKNYIKLFKNYMKKNNFEKIEKIILKLLITCNVYLDDFDFFVTVFCDI